MSAPSWPAIARKDFEDAVRSKMLWGLLGVFVGLLAFLLLAVNAAKFTGGGAEGAVAYVAQWAQLYVPLLTLVAGYLAVVGERNSGSLRVLLTYPFTRRDVVAGKLAGRSAVITVTLVAAFGVLAVLTVVTYGEIPAMEYVQMVLAAVLFGLAFTGIAVGISAATSTRGTALAVSLGVFLVFLIIWNGLTSGLYHLVYGSLPGLKPEPWYLFAQRLNPIETYRIIADSILDPYVEPLFGVMLVDLPADTTPEMLLIENRVEGELPFYLTDWFAVVILAAWAVVPAALGYLRFEKSDLN